MKKSHFLLVIVYILIYACNKETDNQPTFQIDTEIVKAGNIDFSSLQAGQKTYFKRYEYMCDVDPDVSIYSGDTLVLEVIQSGPNLALKEYSKLKTGDTTDPVEFPVAKDGSYILIPEREQSQLLFFFGSDSINFNPTDLVELEQGECNILIDEDSFRGDEKGFISHFNVHDVHAQNKLVISCVPIVELEAYIVYDKKQLVTIHKHWISEFNGHVSSYVEGYELINE